MRPAVAPRHRLLPVPLPDGNPLQTLLWHSSLQYGAHPHKTEGTNQTSVWAFHVKHYAVLITSVGCNAQNAPLFSKNMSAR